MKTLVVSLLAMFIGVSLTFAQTDKSVKIRSVKSQKTPEASAKKAVNKKTTEQVTTGSSSDNASLNKSTGAGDRKSATQPKELKRSPADVKKEVPVVKAQKKEGR
jgi:hypothetical protein